MRPSYLLTVALLLSIVAGLAWWIGRERLPVLVTSPAPDSGSTVVESGYPGGASQDKSVRLRASGRSADRVGPQLLAVDDILETARSLNSPSATAKDDLEIVHSLLAFFRQLNNGMNPGGGLNEEIVDQLRGKNSKRFTVLPPDLPSINADGQLLDRWGTPYYFHPVSGREMEVRSAGPDRRLWTDDDIEG